ncbi:MAG: 2-C-methyl-D-erythritol 2,4-cyclodiphosphate synthase [Rhodopseudomonas palustris]|nr:2-C-methyl-D-erythritol 2,4-cyclodiphosphate synthase [Rhodopseudomonas palustris]
MKLTTSEDFVREELRLAALLGDIRTGTGYDVHAFGDGDHVWLCGLKVPHNRGFLAHSDGDVGLHALVDAILGALADGDIGSHFPPTDPQWKGAASDKFLKYAVERRGRARRPDCQSRSHHDLRAPENRPAARQRCARALLRSPACRSSGSRSKATTSEQLGFTGRQEGIAATASATVRLPWGPNGLSG